MPYMRCLDSTTNLTYALAADPMPLEVSPATADMELVITNQPTASNPSPGPVAVKGIAITVVVGDGANALTGLTTTALGYQIEPTALWQVVAPAPAAGDDVYTIIKSDGGTGVMEPDDSISLLFESVPINAALGTTVLSLAEKTSLGGGAMSWALSKFPAGFSFANLRVVDPQNTQNVLSQVPHGGAIRLLWDGSVTVMSAYEVYYSTAAGQQSGSLSELNQWDLAQVYEDTIFNVVLTLNDQSGVQVSHSLAASVAVAQPDLSVSSISLAGTDLAGELETMTKSLVPKGTIAMWSGAANAVPTGWALCDGTNGTPNLVNQFILGAGAASGDPQPAASGGSASHTHAATANVGILPGGAHTHSVPSSWYSNTASSGGGVTIVDRNSTEVQGAQTQTAGEHTHSASAVVSVDATTTRPPWYALCFIIKQI